VTDEDKEDRTSDATQPSVGIWQRHMPPLQSALQLIGNVIAVSISSLVYHGQKAGRAGVKPGAITRRHGLERVLARGATIAAHLIGAAADREHSAYRAVATAEQEVKCASDESFHFSEFKKLFLNSSWVGFGAEIRDGVGEGWKRQG